MADGADNWVFDSLVNFLRGPIWNVPILTLIENKSLGKDTYNRILGCTFIAVTLFILQCLSLKERRNMKQSIRRSMRTTRTWYVLRTTSKKFKKIHEDYKNLVCIALIIYDSSLPLKHTLHLQS